MFHPEEIFRKEGKLEWRKNIKNRRLRKVHRSMDDSISVVVVIVVVVVEVVSHIYCTNYFDKTSNSNLLSLLF